MSRNLQCHRVLPAFRLYLCGKNEGEKDLRETTVKDRKRKRGRYQKEKRVVKKERER